MGLVEEFEQAILERIKNGEQADEVLTRKIVVDEPILEYQQGDKKELSAIFVRHSKETDNAKVMVFALHGKELFSWI